MVVVVARTRGAAFRTTRLTRCKHDRSLLFDHSTLVSACFDCGSTTGGTTTTTWVRDGGTLAQARALRPSIRGNGVTNFTRSLLHSSGLPRRVAGLGLCTLALFQPCKRVAIVHRSLHYTSVQTQISASGEQGCCRRSTAPNLVLQVTLRDHQTRKATHQMRLRQSATLNHHLDDNEGCCECAAHSKAHRGGAMVRYKSSSILLITNCFAFLG